MSAVGRALGRLAIRLTVALLVVLFLWFFGPLVWRLFSPFILALLVAVMLQRPIRWAEKRMRLKHGAAVAIWVILVCAAICGLLYWIISTIVFQILQISGNYQAIVNDIISILRGAANSVLSALDYLPTEAEQWLRGALNDAFVKLGEAGTSLLGQVVNFTISIASGIPYGLIYLNFLLLGIYFIAADYRGIKARLFGMMGDSTRARSEQLSGTAWSSMGGYVRVQFLYGVLVLLVSWPMLSLFGLPYALLISLLAALLEFLPIFGNGTLYIPWGIICFIIGLPRLGTGLLLLTLGLNIFRRVTEPKLLSNHMGLSPLLSLISMFVGMELYGVIGLIFAPVVLVVVQSAWRTKIFESTLADVRCLFAHLRGVLAEPCPPVSGGDGGEPPDSAPCPCEESDQNSTVQP